MKIRSVLILTLMVFVFSGMIFSNNSTGTINKIRFFHSISDDSSFAKSLSEFDFKKLPRNRVKNAIVELERIGDDFADKGELEKADIVYRVIAKGVPEYWQIFNKIESINRLRSPLSFDIKLFLKQILSLLYDDDSLFVFSSVAVTSIYFSAILVFFIFAISLFYKNFNLFFNDSINTRNNGVSVSKILVFSAALLWPLLFLSGWMIFPFLISGLLWTYFGKREKVGIIVIVTVIIIFSSLFSVISYIKKNKSLETFLIASEISAGKIYKKRDYLKLDNELKVYLAYVFYENKDFDSALDILLSTGKSYRSALKYNLFGNIYFKSGNFKESLKYYKNSLELDENDQVAIYNFTMALAYSERSKVFNSYGKRFPQINHLRNEVHQLKTVKIDNDLLKRRIFNNSNENFDMSVLILEITKEFIKLPIIWFSLILILYIYFIKYFFKNLGESARCFKCSKITRKSNTYKGIVLCNECHQLFKVKDVIFLEAKVAKEQKIRKRDFYKGFLIYILSVFLPGLKLIFTRKYISFIVFSIIFYSIAIFSIAGKSIFRELYSTYPIVFSISSLVGIMMYLFVNIYTAMEDSYGF